jgi:hypothetical protein
LRNYVEAAIAATAASKQVLQRDGKLADAPAGRVEHGIGDRRRDANDRHLAQSLDPQGIDVRIMFFHEDRGRRSGHCMLRRIRGRNPS